MKTTKEFYRIVYSDKNYSPENKDTLDEAIKRRDYRSEDNGKIFKVTEISEEVS